ncbi:hypothetical protein HMPREF2826_00975 [Olsenella sp. HMSC062G07]|nr:hypothetical protein HMPREF2826_00975 [Olsenella sp. HMSC062G07]
MEKQDRMTKNIMTQGAYNRLEQSIKQLEDVERPRVIAAIQEARDHGDLSENSEYDDAREAQGQLEAKISEMRSQLANAVIVESSTEFASLESEVTIADEAGATRTVTIVSASEVDVLSGKISNNSPLGGALFNHTIGEKVSYVLPSGKAKTVTIVAVKPKYDDAADGGATK